MKNNVYLIPQDNGRYEAFIGAIPPHEDAVLLTAEGEYPVDYYYCRYDVFANPIYQLTQCVNQEDLISSLNWSGRCYHRVRTLWDYDDVETENARIHQIFSDGFSQLQKVLADDTSLDWSFDDITENSIPDTALFSIEGQEYMDF